MKCVYELMPSERQRAGDAARRRMEEMFSEERVVKAYLDCLSA
jgi:glycosyltransferase involved in cell wall biosynthesis